MPFQSVARVTALAAYVAKVHHGAEKVLGFNVVDNRHLGAGVGEGATDGAVDPVSPLVLDCILHQVFHAHF